MSAQINKKRGYLFENEILTGLRIEGIDAHKIPDAKSMRTMTTIKNPADFIASVGDKIITIEAKTTKLNRLPWANFREHQIQWCLNNPSCAYFVINFNNRKSGPSKINESFLVTAEHLEKWMDEHSTSIPLQIFRDECLELPRKTGSHNPLGTGAFIDFSEVEL